MSWFLFTYQKYNIEKNLLLYEFDTVFNHCNTHFKIILVSKAKLTNFFEIKILISGMEVVNGV